MRVLLLALNISRKRGQIRRRFRKHVTGKYASFVLDLISEPHGEKTCLWGF